MNIDGLDPLAIDRHRTAGAVPAAHARHPAVRSRKIPCRPRRRRWSENSCVSSLLLLLWTSDVSRRGPDPAIAMERLPRHRSTFAAVIRRSANGAGFPVAQNASRVRDNAERRRKPCKVSCLPARRGLELMTFPDPTPGPGEVVIEMKASGMCGSDLHQYRRPKIPAAQRHRPAAQPQPDHRRPRAMRRGRGDRARTCCRPRPRSASG